jgi:hypothetical protein
MPNREQRRHGTDPKLEKWIHVEDAQGNPYDIYFKDISGKDEWDFAQQQTGDSKVGLCDIFLEGRMTLIGIAGLIWCARRRYEKKLTIQDVLRSVNMATIETMELHDPEDEDEEEEPQEATSNGSEVPKASQSSAVRQGPSSPVSEPSTTSAP